MRLHRENPGVREARRVLDALSAPAPGRTAFLAAAAFSFAVHGFLFAGEFFSHDSVSYYAYSRWGLSFYAGAGRFLLPLYERIKGDAAAPWLVGLLFAVWTALAGRWVCRALDLRTRGGVILACGLLVSNASLALTGATYVYCLDEYALALACGALAALLFQREGLGALWGLGPLVASLALYQPYFTVAASLCLLALLRRTRAGEGWRRVLRAGCRQLALLAAGFGVWYGLWSGVCAVTGVAKQRTEESLLSGGLSALPGLVGEANAAFFRELFRPGVLGWLLPAVNAALLALLLWRTASLLADRRRPLGDRLLLFLLVCLLPTALRSAAVLLPGQAHGLTLYAAELWYLPALEDGERTPLPVRAVLAGGLCLVLWQHTVFANQLYLKKDLEKNATLVLAAQVVGRVEAAEGYVPGETPVAFAGRLDGNAYLARERDAFSDLYGLTGQWSSWSATYNLGRYLTDYLGYPLVWDTSRDYAALPEVEAMPVYPARGSVALVEGTVVVKLSE